MKTIIILAWLALASTAYGQQTDIHLSTNVKLDNPPNVGAVELILQYPSTFQLNGFTFKDNAAHIGKTFAESTHTAKTVHIALANATGFKEGLFLKVSFTRLAVPTYSTVSGDPLGEVFKVISYKVVTVDGVELDETQSAVTATKYNWQ